MVYMYLHYITLYTRCPRLYTCIVQVSHKEWDILQECIVHDDRKKKFDINLGPKTLSFQFMASEIFPIDSAPKLHLIPTDILRTYIKE